MTGSPSLTHAFNAARYRLPACNGLIRIGRHPEPGVKSWLAQKGFGVSLWIITADNPQAKPSAPSINTARTEVLDQLLTRPGLLTSPTVHEDPAGLWPDEYGRLIAGLDEGLAHALGRRFDQAAIVRLAINQPARLVWLDEPIPCR